MVPPDSDRVSRVRPYSGTNLIYAPPFAYGAITLCRSTFQKILLGFSLALLTSPTTPSASTGFGLFPLRSPLLWESLFDVFSSAYLDVSLRQVSLPYPMYSGMDGGNLLPPGFPIRNSTDQCFFPTPRSLSQVSTSFIAS